MSWDDAAASWDDDPAVRTYAGAAYRSLLEALEQRGQRLDGAAVLDFGCGTGLLTEAIAPKAGRVIALDISAAMVAVLERKVAAGGLDHVEPIAGDLSRLLADPDRAPLDLIVASSVCGFLPDYPKTVTELASLLRPGGLFVQWDWAYTSSDEGPYGLKETQIEAALTGAGLVQVTVDIGFDAPLGEHRMRPWRGIGQAP